MMRYGGNTSCVQVTLSDGTQVILDAGTGIRTLGIAHPKPDGPVHILLTHLHLDHIQGLMFYAPAFLPGQEIVIWGPAAAEAPLRDRIARYISAPLTPVEVRELPCDVSFREAEPTEWRILCDERPRQKVEPRRLPMLVKAASGFARRFRGGCRAACPVRFMDAVLWIFDLLLRGGNHLSRR